MRMEQGDSTSYLTVFKILGCCLLKDHIFIFFLLTNKPSIGGSDGGGGSVWYLVGQNTWQRTLPLNAQLLRSFPKLYKHFLSNLRVDFSGNTAGSRVSTVIDVSFLGLRSITDRITVSRNN